MRRSGIEGAIAGGEAKGKARAGCGARFSLVCSNLCFLTKIHTFTSINVNNQPT